MSYNSKAIKTDVNAKPIPQYYDPVTDEYEVLQGAGGAARQVLYGPDGQPVSIVFNKLAVRAAELEAKIEAVRVLLNTLAGEDFATQTTLAQILAKMIAEPATEAKQDVIAGHVDGVETLLTALTGKDFATQTTLAQILAKMIASPATAAKQDSLATLVGAIEDKLDGVIDGTAPAKTELKGSLMQEYSFNDIPITAGATLIRYLNFTGNIEDIVINISVVQNLTQKLSPKYMFNLARYGYTATNMLIPIPAHVDTVKGFVSTKFDVLGSKMRVDITNPETETDIGVNIAIRAFIRGSAENANVLMTTA